MKNITDDRGFNQVWRDSLSTRIRAERRCDYIVSHMQSLPSKTVLEIGCGQGTNSFQLAKKTGMNVLGTDLCIPFIEEAKKNYQLPNLRYDILDFNKVLQFNDQRFDYIIGNGILHHLYYNLDEAFVNITRLLNPSGKIIFIEPNIYNPYVAAIFKNKNLRKLAKLEPDEMAFSKSFIHHKLQLSGFINIKVEYKDFLLPGIPELFIKPSILIGDFVEKTPLKIISQSILISALKN